MQLSPCKRLIILNYEKSYPKRKENCQKTIVLIPWPLSLKIELNFKKMFNKSVLKKLKSIKHRVPAALKHACFLL